MPEQPKFTPDGVRVLPVWEMARKPFEIAQGIGQVMLRGAQELISPETREIHFKLPKFRI